MPNDTNTAAAKRDRGIRILRGQRERLRGYRLNKKMIAMAYTVEAAIISSSLYASWVFAEKYAGAAESPRQVAALDWLFTTTHSLDWKMAMVGGITVAVAETVRLPLAQASRTQSSATMRVIAIVGVLMMAFVTTKAMAQVLQQTYAPRLHQVQMAMAELKIAEADLATIAAMRGFVETALVPLEQDVRDAQKRVDDLNRRTSEQGQAPKPECWAIYKKNRKGKSYKAGVQCKTPSWAGQQFADRLPAAMQELQEAIARRDAAAGGVAIEVEQIVTQEHVVTKLKNAQREAVMNSVLHGLTGIFYGIDPLDLTESQVNAFLRLFILVPSLMIALASSLLVMTAYQRIGRPKDPTTIYVQIPEALREVIGNDNTNLKVA